MADGLKGRGVHLYPDTTPTRYDSLLTLQVALPSCRPISERVQVRPLRQCNDASRIEKEADGTFKVYYKNKDGESSVKAGIVMFGTGRSPNTKNIGLEVRHPNSHLQC